MVGFVGIDYNFAHGHDLDVVGFARTLGQNVGQVAVLHFDEMVLKPSYLAKYWLGPVLLCSAGPAAREVTCVCHFLVDFDL